MISKTPTSAPFPVDFFLKLSTREQSKIAKETCDNKDNAPCNIPVRVGIFFDGTNNNLERDRNGVRTGVLDPRTKKPTPINNVVIDSNEASHSNVARLFSAYPGDKTKNGYFSYYIPGVGTPFKEIGELTESDEGKAFAKGGQARIIWGLLQVLNAIHRVIYGSDTPLYESDKAGELSRTYDNAVGHEKVAHPSTGRERFMTHSEWFAEHIEKLKAAMAAQPKPHIPSLTLSVFGFSRGAAEAVAFCQLFADLLTPREGEVQEFAGILASIDFLGVFDTVATVGSSASVAKTTIAPGAMFDGHWAWANELLKPLPLCVKAGLHSIAAHEQRMNFPVTRLTGKIEEVYFPGVHSDVGGGYGPGEQGKGRGGQAALLSQIPLAHMFKEARLKGVPLIPFSELELRDQEDFLVSQELAKAWEAYTAELAKQGDLLSKHMQLYYRWRAVRVKTLEATTSFKAASAQEREDLGSYNRLLAGDLEALRARKAFLHGDEGQPFIAQDSKRINHWQFYRAQNHIYLDKWEAWALDIFDHPEPLPPEVMRFFDDYVHDSLAGFYMAGEVTEYDKRAKIASFANKPPKDGFYKRAYELNRKTEAAQLKQKNGEALTPEEEALVKEAQYGTPYPIRTDADSADMRSGAITTQTYTRREGGGYILRRGYYPQSGFFRKSVHEKELQRMPTAGIRAKEAPEEFVWSENLVQDIAQAKADEEIYLAQQRYATRIEALA
ncbi:phospholipase effector Tle1 domain-containing protein [Janthinobacterium sp. DSP2-3-3]|uniref:phospholipase effector Tle1 domain-containing protein n=1 Tax=Janthinobacterium sp. DSP2-3-3 TaxID=2804596 RepID=UPI003CEA3652